VQLITFRSLVAFSTKEVFSEPEKEGRSQPRLINESGGGQGRESERGAGNTRHEKAREQEGKIS
jgi:hypothetical protein